MERSVNYGQQEPRFGMKVVRQRTDGVPSGVAVHVVERCFYYCHCGMAVEPHPRFGLTRETPAGRAAEFSLRPAAFCQRLLCASRTPRTCCHRQTMHFPQERARSREPASSLTRTQIPARHGTGGAESTQAMGKAAAEMCSVTGTTMAAELLRSTTAIHHFATHAAHTQRIWLKTLSNAATSG